MCPVTPILKITDTTHFITPGSFTLRQLFSIYTVTATNTTDFLLCLPYPYTLKIYQTAQCIAALKDTVCSTSRESACYYVDLPSRGRSAQSRWSVKADILTKTLGLMNAKIWVMLRCAERERRKWLVPINSDSYWTLCFCQNLKADPKTQGPVFQQTRSQRESPPATRPSSTGSWAWIFFLHLTLWIIHYDLSRQNQRWLLKDKPRWFEFFFVYFKFIC